MIKRIAQAAATLCVVALAACGGPRPDTNAEGAPTVTVSIPPLAWLASEIGGDSLVVNSLLTSSADPETFEPGMGTMKRLADSRALLTTGVLPFEQALVDNIMANNRQLRVLQVTDSVPLLYGTHSHSHADGHHHHDHADGHHHDAPSRGNAALDADPHVWLSVPNMRIMAANMLEAIVEVDPARETYYRSRHAVLDLRLDSLQRLYAEAMDTLRGSSFAIWHPSLSYLARDYGLEQVAFNAENKETSTIRLGNKLDRAGGSGVRTFFIPAGLPPAQAATISNSLKIAPVTFNQLDADWPGQMQAIVEAIVGKPLDNQAK